MFYVCSDQVATAREITNVSGAKVWQADAEPFGANMPNENPSGQGAFTYNPRFPGQYYDKETGLHYNYYRDYDPQTGRYVQSDPIGLAGGINTYAYASGNPIRLVDPKGLAYAAPSPVTRLEIAIVEGDIATVEMLVEAGASPASLAQAAANLNKITHIFGKVTHNLAPLVKACGSPGKALQTLQAAAQAGAAPIAGAQEFVVIASGIQVTVRGAMVGGIFRLGTAFVP